MDLGCDGLCSFFGTPLPHLKANITREEGEGGGGSGTQKCVYQKWPDQIFPIANFVFPTMVTLVCGGGGGVLLWLSAVLM